MSITVVIADADGLPLFDANGNPVTKEVPDGTQIKSVNGWAMELTAADQALLVAVLADYAAKEARPKAQRIDEDLLAQAEFVRNPVFRAIIAELLARLPVPPTPAEFRDAVKARLVADPEV